LKGKVNSASSKMEWRNEKTGQGLNNIKQSLSWNVEKSKHTNQTVKISRKITSF